MVSGIFFALATALLWVGIGAVQGYGGRRHLNLALMQSASAVLLIGIYAIQCTVTDSWSVPHGSILMIMPLAGAANLFTMVTMGKAMEHGPNGIVWALIQSALVMPFTMGILFFHVPCTPGRLAGLVIIVFSMIIMGVSARSNDARSKGTKWILTTLEGFLAAGITQCLENLPSYFVRGDMEAGVALRCILYQVGTLIAFMFFYGKEKESWRGLRPARWAILFLTAVTFLSLLTLLWSLDAFAMCNLGAIGYPLVLGSSNIMFFIYTAIVLRERPKPAAVLGMLSGVAGIAMLILL